MRKEYENVVVDELCTCFLRFKNFLPFLASPLLGASEPSPELGAGSSKFDQADHPEVPTYHHQ